MNHEDQAGGRNNGPETNRLDGALRAAFGMSVLTTIESASGSVPRVLLRPTAEGESPVLKPHGRCADSIGPRYQTVGDTGTNGDAQRFQVRVFVGTDSWGEGVGRSKRIAEQAAAPAALDTARLDLNDDG